MTINLVEYVLFRRSRDMAGLPKVQNQGGWKKCLALDDGVVLGLNR
jgi:hypothetical protein